MDVVTWLSYFGPVSTTLPSAKNKIMSFNLKGRSLLHNIDIYLSGIIAVDTVAGRYLTAESVLRALVERKRRRTTSSQAATKRAEMR